jgi:UDP-N-acetylglucosamine 3-dehydrogenase
MGTSHARVLSQIDGVEVVAGVDPRLERRQSLRRANPQMGAYARLEQALEETEQIDFVALAVPAPYLAELGQMVIAAGLPLLVEKPLASTEADGLALVEEAESRGVLLGVGHVERCNPAVRALKKQLDANAIGRVYQVHARRLSPFPERDSMLGVSLDLATHDIDVMRYLIGSEIERVFAESAQRLHDRAEDLIAATLRFGDSTTGLLEVNWLTPAKVRELSVTGEGGTYVVNYLSQELYFFKHPSERTTWDALRSMRGAGEGDMIRYALQRREPLLVEWETFLSAMDGVDTHLASGRDGYAALSTARAIQLSGTCHETVAPGYRVAVNTSADHTFQKTVS